VSFSPIKVLGCYFNLSLFLYLAFKLAFLSFEFL